MGIVEELGWRGVDSLCNSIYLIITIIKNILGFNFE